MKWFKSGIFLVIFISSTFAAPTPSADDPLRLPKTSVPLNYEITLTTNVHNNGERAFNGVMKIEVEIKENTNVITLHNRGLKVDSLKLLTESGSEISQTQRFETDKDFMHLDVARQLNVGEKYSIEINYNGLLQLDMRGFYRSSYRAGSVTRYISLITLSKTIIGN
jgi:Peptidase M1 N-terminal domain